MRGHGIWCWLVWWSKAMTKFTECIWVFLGWSDIAKRWPALYGAGMVCDLIQSILIPMLSSFYHCFHSIKRILRSFQPQCGSHFGRGKKYQVLLEWHGDIFVVQKIWMGQRLMMPQRFSIRIAMFWGTNTMGRICRVLYWKVGVRHGKTKIAASWWHVVNSDRQIKCARSLITQHLLASWQSVFDYLEWPLSPVYNWRFWWHLIFWDGRITTLI